MSPFYIGVFLCKNKISPLYMEGSIEPESTTTTGDSVQSPNLRTFQIITAETTMMPNVRP